MGAGSTGASDIRVGDVQVIALSDGEFIARSEFFGPGASFEGHQEFLDADGVMRLPVGAFALRGRDGTTLVDAGIGAVRNETFNGGRLLDDMAARGVSMDEVDRVVCTHLHPDHTGWLVRRDNLAPVFPNAVIMTGAADWELFVNQAQRSLARHVLAGLRSLAEADRVRQLDGDVPIASGITCVSAPGHTPGHVVVVVSSGSERLLLLGDAITCPLQLQETDWGAMSDVDPALAARTREALWREMEGDSTRGVGAHFPGLQFGRVLRGVGRRWSV